MSLSGLPTCFLSFANRRVGTNLVTTVRITLWDALRGFQKELQGIDGQRVTLEYPRGSFCWPGTKRIFHGHGMPSPSTQARGDLIVELVMEYPDAVPPAISAAVMDNIV